MAKEKKIKKEIKETTCKVCGRSLRNDDYCSLECAEKDPTIQKPCVIEYGDRFYGVVGIKNQHEIKQKNDGGFVCIKCGKAVKNNDFDGLLASECSF